MQSESRVNVLMVDDHPENLLALEAILDGLDQNLVKAHSGEEALRCLLHQDFAVILLDVQMPGMDGFETASLIRKRDRSRDTPIIFLTAFSTSDDLMFRGYSLGAVDYLLKPIDPTILISKVTVFVDLFVKTAALKHQTAQLQVTNAELRASNERFRSLSACSPVGIVMTDVQGNCTYTNPRCQAIAGFSTQDGLGNGWINFIHPEDRVWVVQQWQEVIRDGKPYSQEFRFQWQDGTIRWAHVRSAPMLSDLGALIGFVGTIEDITDRKQMEQARAQFLQEQIARQQAEAANRMKDEFLGTLSHELRTPLNAMMGWARLLRTRKFDAETTDRALETIERNACSQAQLIEDILDVSRIITGKLRLVLRPINVTPLLEAAVEAARPIAESKNLVLKVDLSAAESWTSGDPDRLNQVFGNLLSNAIKFTAEGGQVEVRLEHVSQSPPSIPQSLETQDITSLPNDFLPPTLLISFADTGVGIPPNFLPHVFERFRQADSTTTRPHGGLGLGLAIARHIIEMHGGTIQALSEGEGKGATFQLVLPLLSSRARSPASSGIIFEKSQGLMRETQDNATALNEAVLQGLSGLQVLVVEDDSDTRELLAFVLQQNGARVTAVASAAEAIVALHDECPDILVSDIGMPEEDGYSLIRRIRTFPSAHIPDVPAIALTAYAREEERTLALNAGFNAHIAKPVDTLELISAIQELAKASVH
ncbi:MAG: response regulator [Leptolyngbyaceae cyanobacterium bins.59]|nr:response regulator [Leptolyngbyaceae cyanobacterium bins.59]